MAKFREGAIIYIVGAPGYGKTTLCNDVITRLRARGRRILAYDLTGDIASGLERMRYKPYRITRYQTLESEWVKRVEKPDIICWDGKPRDVDPELLAKNWVYYANRYTTTNDVMVCDECEHAFPIHDTDANARRIMTTSRNDERLVIVATKRPQTTHNLLRSNTRFLIVFGIPSETIIKHGLNEFGRDWRMFAPAMELPKFHYLYMDLHNPEQKRPIIVDSREYYPPFLDVETI